VPCIDAWISPALVPVMVSFSLLMSARLPISSLFPYTTLFRSNSAASYMRVRSRCSSQIPLFSKCRLSTVYGAYGQLNRPPRHLRSEEHTSELQSRENLVCRLLLEKKKLCNHMSDQITRTTTSY